MTARAPALLPFALLLLGLLSRPAPGAPASTAAFEPVPLDPPGARGLLRGRGTEPQDAPVLGLPASELRRQLDHAETHPAELPAVLSRWQQLAGTPFETASGRTGVRLATEAPLGPDWTEVNRRLLLRFGESRFGDALEAARYRDSWQRGSPHPRTPEADVLLRFRTGDAEGLALNLFETGSATLKLDGQEVTVHVLSRFPREGTVQVQFRMNAPARFAFWVRVPGWAPELRIRSLAANTEWIGLRGDWARLPVRAWAGSDWLELSFPLRSERVERSYRWGPLLLAGDPERAPEWRRRLEPGTAVTQALEHYPFPPAVARPSRPPHPAPPLPPGKTEFPLPERRGWYTWEGWNPRTWEATLGSDPPGQVWHAQVLPYAVTIRHLVFGASPDDLLPGERVNVFLGSGTDGEWSVVNYFQDELTQMQGHHHWWWVRSVQGRRFTARLFTQGDNLLQWPEERFEVARDGEFWRGGARAGAFPLRPGLRVRMISAWKHGHREVRLLTDDAGLEALRKRKEEAERARLRREGLGAFVDGVDDETARLTIFSTYWRYGHEYQEGQALRIAATGPGYRATGTAVPVTVVSAHVTGKYGSGDTELKVRGDVRRLRAWMGGRVVRVVAE